MLISKAMKRGMANKVEKNDKQSEPLFGCVVPKTIRITGKGSICEAKILIT
jgi:hypothetical protein